MTPTWRRASNSTSSQEHEHHHDQVFHDGTVPVNQYAMSSVTSVAAPHQPVYDKNYVEELRKSFWSQQTEKQVVRNNEKLGTSAHIIHRRIREHGYPCGLNTLTCLSGYCGRSFERIEVLAFHLSYAHQDLMNTSNSAHLTCLLCGKKWTTVRRKIMHLSLAHREIGEEHNNQCMLQVESVIAPNAPKAIRLEKARRVYDDGLQQELAYEEEEVEEEEDPFLAEPEVEDVDDYNY